MSAWTVLGLFYLGSLAVGIVLFAVLWIVVVRPSNRAADKAEADAQEARAHGAGLSLFSPSASMKASK